MSAHIQADSPPRGASRATTLESSPILDQSGRPLGPRAQKTRRRLLAVTEELLDECLVRDISVVEIARRAGTSPATFYQYFKDVSEATLCLAEQVGEEMPTVLAALEGPWDAEHSLASARRLVTSFVEHWQEHRAVLLIRNLASDQGDERFIQVRNQTHGRLFSRLQELIARSVADGQLPTTMNPTAGAAALSALLERLAAHQRGLEGLGVSKEEFAETVALILHQTIAGVGAPSA